MTLILLFLVVASATPEAAAATGGDDTIGIAPAAASDTQSAKSTTNADASGGPVPTSPGFQPPASTSNGVATGESSGTSVGGGSQSPSPTGNDWVGTVVAVLIVILFTGEEALFGLIRKRVWSWWTRRREANWAQRVGKTVSASFARSHKRRWRGQWIGCLAEYVGLLTCLRETLVNRCQESGDRIPAIHIFTRQLPRDWPLWGTAIQGRMPEKTPLEEYVFDFHAFLCGKGKQARLRRAIVVDNVLSPTGLDRVAKLCEDIAAVQSFKHYAQLLHHSEEEVRIWLYQRPWPGWLADSVFYGASLAADEMQVPDEWYWAANSSFDAQEDLIMISLRSKLTTAPDPLYPLPAPCRDLKSLADLLVTADVSDTDAILKLNDFRECFARFIDECRRQSGQRLETTALKAAVKEALKITET